jgi:pantoate--beta-alanine ligase
VRVIKSPQQIQAICLALKKIGKSIAIVPTMGYLHEGHLTLLRKARKKADIVVLTIFVNPTQFGPKEDFTKYPRDKKGDLAKARKCNVDFVFTPSSQDMYPVGCQTSVDVAEMTQGLCGSSRPGHFRGVTTIVLKLFNLITPDYAFFGLKDYQQYAVISCMVKDLNLPVKMVGVPTIREKDGLAMSSRNVYLSAEERNQALSLSKGLAQASKELKTKKNLHPLKNLRHLIEAQPLARIDYISCVNSETLKPLKTYLPGKTLIALAVFFGPTRLIDNVVV